MTGYASFAKVFGQFGRYEKLFDIFAREKHVGIQ